MNPAVNAITIDTLPRFPRQVLSSIIIHVRGEEFIQKGNPEGKKKFGPLRTTPPSPLYIPTWLQITLKGLSMDTMKDRTGPICGQVGV